MSYLLYPFALAFIMFSGILASAQFAVSGGAFRGDTTLTACGRSEAASGARTGPVSLPHPVTVQRGIPDVRRRRTLYVDLQADFRRVTA